MVAMLIGVAHGLPIFLAGAISNKHGVVVVTAGLMLWVAATFGNPAFFLTDLAWIVIGTLLGWSNCK
jgi:hypothetical protein